ncbi:MAG: hypothetical protein IE881_08075, partial [Epsilonproteobacteria bacterium]|nr:hypothetical protein [Campylobacterota bacterium]
DAVKAVMDTANGIATSVTNEQFELLGITGVSDENLDEIVKLLQESLLEGNELDSLSELQGIVKNVNEILIAIANEETQKALDATQEANDETTTAQISSDEAEKLADDSLATAKIAQEKAILAKEAQDNALENPTQENVDLAKTAQENATKASQNAINVATETQNALDDYLQSVTMAGETPADTSAVESSIDNANDKAGEAKVAVKTQATTTDLTLEGLESGTYSLYTFDNAGKVSIDKNVVTVKDMSTPIPTVDIVDSSDTGSSNTDNITSDTTPTITGTAEVGATISNNGTVTSLVSGVSGTSISLGDMDNSSLVNTMRDYTVTGLTTDSDGNNTLSIRQKEVGMNARDLDFVRVEVTQNSVAGDDTLDGGAGDDMLFGAEGNDTLIGGFGADLFVYSQNINNGVDVIKDFAVGVDSIMLTDLLALGNLDAQRGDLVSSPTITLSDLISSDALTGHATMNQTLTWDDATSTLSMGNDSKIILEGVHAQDIQSLYNSAYVFTF